MDRQAVGSHIVLVVVFLGLATLLAFLVPWKTVTWGKLELTPSSVITVIGEADSQEKNQIASFSAGVSAVSDNKDAAIKEVNDKVAALTVAVKNFGIADADIQTQNLSINQQQEQYYEEGRQKMRAGQWNVNNTITITLRDVARASDLASVLTSSGATNVYGPNFSLDDTKNAEVGLLELAIQNARVKAEKMATATGKQLGTVVSVTEGGAVAQPYYARLEAGGGMGGGAPIEPGTGTVYKTVTVTFELK